jgi:hypothetical protein
MGTSSLFLKERDDHKEESFLLENNCLIIPNKLITPFQSYKERKGEIKGEIHYFFLPKYLYHKQVFINELPERIKYFGILFPSGRVKWHLIARMVKVEGVYKIIINNQRPLSQSKIIKTYRKRVTDRTK